MVAATTTAVGVPPASSLLRKGLPPEMRGERLSRLFSAAVVAVYDAVYAVGQVGWR